MDDLNTPQAVAALSEPLKATNDLLFTKKGKKVRRHICFFWYCEGCQEFGILLIMFCVLAKQPVDIWYVVYRLRHLTGSLLRCFGANWGSQMPSSVAVILQAKDRLEVIRANVALFQATLQLLGLIVADPAAQIGELRELALLRAGVTEADISAAITARAEARKAKNYEEADSIRQEFAAKGIGFQDSPQGTTWRPVLAAER